MRCKGGLSFLGPLACRSDSGSASHSERRDRLLSVVPANTLAHPPWNATVLALGLICWVAVFSFFFAACCQAILFLPESSKPTARVPRLLPDLLSPAVTHLTLSERRSRTRAGPS